MGREDHQIRDGPGRTPDSGEHADQQEDQEDSPDPLDAFPGHGKDLGKGTALAEGIAGKQQETQEKSSQERALEEDKEKQDQAECQQYTVFHKVILSAGE